MAGKLFSFLAIYTIDQFSSTKAVSSGKNLLITIFNKIL
jgi:hypothetical protein